nr:hypothetical protein [Tanacetum cinerariifolium]
MDAIQELASPKANDFCDSPLLGVNTPRCDEDRLKLMELMVFLLQKNVRVEIGITAARLSSDVTRLRALVDKKKIVISAVIREILQLNDAEGVNQVEDLSTHTTRFISPALTQKVFANIRRVGKGFSGVEMPLFEGMLADRQPVEEELVADQVQVDAAVAATVEEIVVEDVSHDAIPSPPSHDIPSSSQEPSSPSQQPHVTPPAPTQGANFQQKLEIVKLKARVKKLEKTHKVKSSKFRRLRKDADIADTEGRQADKQAEIYNIDLDHSSKVLSMQEDDSEVQDVVEVVTTAKLITDVVTAAASQPSIHAAAPTVVAAYTRRRKGVIIRDPEEELSLKTSAETPVETPKVKDKGNGIMVETPKPMKMKDQIELDAEYARKLHEEINKDDAEFNKDIDWDAAMNHNTAGYKMDFFKGMSYADICPIFQARFDENMRFLFKSREKMEEEDEEIIKSIMKLQHRKLKKDQEKDKIGSKPDKNGKRGEAGKCQKQLQWIKEEKPSKTQKE